MNETTKQILNEHSDLEPELRPEYKMKLAKIVRGKHFSREEFEKRC